MPEAETDSASASDPSSVVRRPSSSASASASDPSSVVRSPSSSDSDTSQRSVLSPVVRKLAGEHNVDVAMVRGSGHGGRVTRKDVEAFIASRGDTGQPGRSPATPPAVPAPPLAALVPPITHRPCVGRREGDLADQRADRTEHDACQSSQLPTYGHPSRWTTSESNGPDRFTATRSRRTRDSL